MRVLVAEDSLMTLRLLAGLLRQWDYQVTEARDGAEAWRLFQDQAFSLVLTDWAMPQVDGLELIRRIRAEDRPEYTYIILLTAKNEKGDLVEAMEVGADDFLVKPSDPAELRARLHAGERIIRLQRTLSNQYRELRETQAALVQSEKLASVGQLAAGMAHEINNPIAYVTNNLAVLQREVKSLVELVGRYRIACEPLRQADSVVADSLAMAEDECDLPWLQENLPHLFHSSLEGLARVREIVKNLRDFAHLDEAEYDTMNVAAALESTLQVLQHELNSQQVEVRTDFAPTPPIVGHPAKIKQALHDVLLNAIQASRPKGIVEVRLRPSDHSAVIEVQDYGRGIDPTTRNRIFEPFFTTRPVGSGKGLGLAISYGTVREHGGMITFESEPGRGATFRIELPYDAAGTLHGTLSKAAEATTQK